MWGSGLLSGGLRFPSVVFLYYYLLSFTRNDKYANALLVVVSLDRGRAWQCCYFLVLSHMWFPPATTLRLAAVLKVEWVIKKQE